jgi:predicted hydrolase (HD superfamily)
MIDRKTALSILNKNLTNKNLLRHCLAVEAAMKGLAKYFKQDENKWALVGLVHDGDWEVTRSDFNNHTKKMVAWLKEVGESDEEIIRAVLSHNYINNKEIPPSNVMEWSLYCCDELTGLIVAVALIMPQKKLSAVTVESVIKKFPSKSFAAAVNREQIKLCEKKLDIKLDEFATIVLQSMKNISSELGL